MAGDPWRIQWKRADRSLRRPKAAKQSKISSSSPPAPIKYSSEKVDLLWRQSHSEPWRRLSQIWGQTGNWNRPMSEERPLKEWLPPSSRSRLLAPKWQPGRGRRLDSLWQQPKTGVWIWWECWAGGSWRACCPVHLPSFGQPAGVEGDWTLRKTGISKQKQHFCLSQHQKIAHLPSHPACRRVRFQRGLAGIGRRRSPHVVAAG